MNKNNKNRDLLTRREFFKKATKSTLPFIAAITVPSFLSSCGGGNDDPIETGCSWCSSNCEGSCEGSCESSCEGSCDNSCTKSNANSSCSDCSSTCKDGCKEGCNNTCKEGCSETCKNTSANEDNNAYGNLDYAVDLGLSVLWATFNVGSKSPEEYGEYTGWGDSDGKKSSVNPDDYPNANPPENICGSEYDIARIQWGDDWRLPTPKEFSELKSLGYEKCNLNGKQGLKITGKNGNSIYLPIGGLRHEGKSYGLNQNCQYWTGERGTKVNGVYSHAEGYEVNGLGTMQFYRYDQLLVRPVTENPKGCRDCSSGCISSCANTCSGNCSGGCKTGCSSTCINGCKEGCMDNCKGGCKKECTTQCTSYCAQTCSNDCGGGCRDNCYGTCEGGCRNTCDNTCGAGCTSNCGFNCSFSCGNTCHKTAF